MRFEPVVVDNRTRCEIEDTVPAGVLERDSVRLLVESGGSDRVLTEGYEHPAIDLRFGGVSHRIDFQRLVGESVWLYPQNDVFTDLPTLVSGTAGTSGSASAAPPDGGRGLWQANQP